MKRLLVLIFSLALAACARAESGVMQGYGEADYIFLSSQETGVVRELLVREGDHVEAGGRVFTLDPARLEYNVETAGAQSAAADAAIRTAEADANLARTNFVRSEELYRRGFYSRARYDADRAARAAADARLAQVRREAGAAQAQTGLAQQRLSDIVGEAPAAGTIEQIFHRPGEVVPAGQPIAALLPPANMKVRFFAPQALLAQLPVGARVLVSCDGVGCEQPLAATVSFVAREPQFTPPVIYSLDQREKLVFLVEARLNAPGPIRPGMPLDVRIAP